jgi:hypothetical protein
MNVHCTDCHTEIPARDAHIRTRSFVRVYFCGSCMEIRGRLAEITAAAREGVSA